MIKERANEPDAFFSLREPVLTRARFLLSAEARYTSAGEGESPSASQLRAHSASTRRHRRALTRPELRGKNESGTGARFHTSTNHQSLLLFSSLPPLLPLAPAASPSSVLSSSVTASAAGSNPAPIHANVLPLRLQRHLPYYYNPCPLHSAGSSHTTYVPRASELVATAGRSLDYAPSLFHHHPTATLAHTLSLYISLCLSLGPHGRPLVPLLLLTISSISTTAVSIRPPFAQSFILVAPTISVLFTDNFGPLLRIVISLATI